MGRNVLVISASLRSNSNSDTLADEFIKGAEAAGNNVEKISLKDKSIAFCKGCLACQQTARCVIKDDAVEISEKMGKADVIAFATPVYYYGMAGQLKTLLDRANPLYPTDYAFRDIYILATAAENEETTPEKTFIGIQGWIDCFEKAELKGTVFAGGCDCAGSIKGHPALQAAFDAGVHA